MNEIQLKTRTKQFALRAIKLVDALPRRQSSRVIGDQVLRSATSVGANYRSACRGRSKAEFIAKLGVVEEEADESAYWLELVMESDLLPAKNVSALHTEALELTAIMAASRITAAKRR